ncbi:quinone oxidoreductase PIG3-like [Littorina saxatilis]|uniref:Enoyl reductase (ER) domain-containing protein n=1 Tax=Littorina saxatilis TaxID=31220 RepID=A0AAN9BLR2_9CAEN
MKVNLNLAVVSLCCVIVVVMRVSSKNMMRAVQFREPGGPENLYIGEVERPVPGKGEVLIKVKATAINRADTLQRKGLYPVPAGVTDILGLEAAGEISEIGPGCNQRWKVGDRVMALLAGGGNAEYVSSPEGQVMPIPSTLDFPQAAAIPEVWVTAFQLLHAIGKVMAGETVLIHGGASGVGTAAIQLCVQAGARPLVTAGSAVKLETTRNLGAVGNFNYKEDDVVAEVMRATNGKGVNIVLDCVGGSMYETNINVLGMDGRWVVYGLMGGGNVNGDLLRKVLAKRLSITGTTLRSRSLQYKEQLVQDFSRLALPLFENRTFRPVIHTLFPLAEIGRAHELMEDNLNTGKIILQVEESTGKEEL